MTSVLDHYATIAKQLIKIESIKFLEFNALRDPSTPVWCDLTVAIGNDGE